ncbi:MAG: NAD-dependent epimerase/dehydratase family protein [Nitrospina sp.]|jgi:nucleoside-diphosphate-sugar epimerase|nr:NAD-dependent epimerase/dehydratase family protein [Nitrospina sp.]MBT3875014.1 NAD-dependent epimerase/dehydratase family protein [Nitrospina sp.]MBT4049665.1 NAD-dependent epimerase/dehydratase family protein [Nitrospina sp.]MBT4556338.1 NAD-dependent epimerase/dehydratase family protein [Nitrospina sp.]MBT5348179.1 NAD-dependent epimerase/dehydratase family protein [Nitrospina sp.]
MRRKFLVTGGTGFLGAHLVKRLLKEGQEVRVLDNDSRGRKSRLENEMSQVEMVVGDIRDPLVVEHAAEGCQSVIHMAYVNGTEFFYTKPELVLEVGVKGMLNVLDACKSQKIRELILISSSEVYQTPPTIPTPEDVPLVIPDIQNPRYSYGGGKAISELLAINYGRNNFDRVVIVRPHNVFGPDMGWEHVVPQFILRAHDKSQENPQGPLEFAIQGQGNETRAFVGVEDFTDGLMIAIEKGGHQEVYHLGTEEEIPIADVARKIVHALGRKIDLKPGPLTPGSTLRRCPDISKIKQLGYSPKLKFDEALAPTVDWYIKHANERPKNSCIPE